MDVIPTSRCLNGFNGQKINQFRSLIDMTFVYLQIQVLILILGLRCHSPILIHTDIRALMHLKKGVRRQMQFGLRLRLNQY